jgi:glycosyltransferase involved in cell wall biosynthesis
MRNSLALSTALKLARLVREHKIQIVHAHLARDYPLAALVAGRSGAQLVLTRHVLFPLSRIHRLTLRRAKTVIAVSNAVADSLRAQKIFRNEQIVVIYNGIDVSRFDTQRRREGSENFRVGTAGHLGPIKGLEDFVRAAALVAVDRADIDFVVAGEDKSATREHRRALESLIGELGLRERIQLIGWVEEIPRFLSTLDAFISPARAEPFGLAIVEAMAAGIPVIATMSEGAREIIEPNVTGILVPIGDVATIANTILEIVRDEALRERLAQRARHAAAERFSLQRMVESTESVYRGARGMSEPGAVAPGSDTAPY